MTPLVAAWCVAALVLGGTVKGMVGFGIPVISVTLMSLAVPVPQAIALISVSLVLSNVIQSVQGGHIVRTFRRHGVLVVALVVGTLAGGRLLAGLDVRILNGVLGGVVVAFALVELAGVGPRRAISPDPRVAALAGGLSGLLGGVSSMFGPPVLAYLTALRLPREEFVGTIATIYLVASIVLIAALTGFGAVGPVQMLWSVGATVPVLGGMAIGQGIGRRVSPARFRRVLLVTLLVVGTRLVWTAVA